MVLNLDTDADTIKVVEDYLVEIKFDGTPEEYFEKNMGILLDNIVKDMWAKLAVNKTRSDKVADIKKTK